MTEKVRGGADEPASGRGVETETRERRGSLTRLTGLVMPSVTSVTSVISVTSVTSGRPGSGETVSVSLAKTPAILEAHKRDIEGHRATLLVLKDLKS